jgi:hypothetical protein
VAEDVDYDFVVTVPTSKKVVGHAAPFYTIIVLSVRSMLADVDVNE